MSIKVLGPYNSGTNLLINILRCNVQSVSTGNDVKVFSNNHLELWKHCNNESTIKSFLDKNQETNIIFVYKNFLSLIHSFKKQSYNIGFKNIFKDKIYFRGRLMNDEKHILPAYESFSEFYYQYYRTFWNILEDPKYKRRVVFVNYEKIIDKSTCFAYIDTILRQRFDCNIKSYNHVITELGKPSKRHHATVNNSDEALQSIRGNKKKIYKELMSQDVKILKNFDNAIIEYYEHPKKRLNEF